MKKVDILRKRLSHISFYTDYCGIILKDKVGGKEENEIIKRVCKSLTKNQIRRIVRIEIFLTNLFDSTEGEDSVTVKIKGNKKAVYIEV